MLATALTSPRSSSSARRTPPPYRHASHCRSQHHDVPQRRRHGRRCASTTPAQVAVAQYTHQGRSRRALQGPRARLSTQPPATTITKKMGNRRAVPVWTAAQQGGRPAQPTSLHLWLLYHTVEAETCGYDTQYTQPTVPCTARRERCSSRNVDARIGAFAPALHTKAYRI